MAKYVLNGTYDKTPRSARCSILDENCISNTYTVQFDNGVIRNVPKNRVKDLDIIDEGVLDRLRDLGSALIDRVIKAGKYVFFKTKDRVLRTISPFTTMGAAQEIDGLGFVPCAAAAARAEAMGIKVRTITDFDEDDDLIDDLNNYYKKVIKAFKANPKMFESTRTSRRHKLYEAGSPVAADGSEEREDPYGLSDKDLNNVDRKQLYEMLISSFYKFSEKGAGDRRISRKAPTPILIWGAPGIGKTDVVKGFIESLQEEEIPANMIYLNLITLRKDDFSLPAFEQVDKLFKTAAGETAKVIKQQRAIDVPKTWFPVWFPKDVNEEEGITVDVLDDVANGGDGTGNGEGGIIFVDELSRVSVDVMNVLMTLIQQREHNGGILGSKWMFVFAANRYVDMGDNAENFMWEDAWGGRFTHVNFVPKFSEWMEWAKQKNHILPIIIDFLEEHPNLWRAPKLAHDNDDQKVKLYPNPRAWDLMSQELEDIVDTESSIHADKTQGSKSSKFKNLSNKLGAAIGSRLSAKDLKPIDYRNAAERVMGKKAADVFAKWAGFDSIFTNDVARDVWTLGDKADVPFQPDPLKIKRAIIKIVTNHPDYDNPKKDPATGKETVDITTAQYANIIKYLIKMVDSTDEQAGGARDSLLAAAKGQLYNLLMREPFYINFVSASPETMAKYKEGNELLGRRTLKTRAEIKANK